MKRKKRKQNTIETYDHVDLESMHVYDDCGMEEKNTFLDRCQRSLECGRNLFAEEWKEWEGYEEGCLY